MRITSVLVLTVVLALPSVSTAKEPSPPEADLIPTLVSQLGSQKFTDREAATRSLDLLGAAALPALKKVLAADDLEICRRAEALVQRIEKRLQTERLLEPKRVRLVFADTPIPEAVAEIKRQTGYTVGLNGDLNQLARRKVTLDTGDCTFWEALQRFCAQAGLRENANPIGNFQEERFQVVQNGAVVTRLMTRHAYAGNFERGLTLYDGPPQSVPSFQTGAVRFRALSPRTTSTGGLPVSPPCAFHLEVMPEPRLAWQGIIETRIERAVDDEGQERMHVTVTQPPSIEAEIRWLIETDFSRPAYPSQVPVQFLPAEKPAKRLREVKGRVTAQVQTPPETVLEIDNILATSGRSFPGAEETLVKVTEVSNPSKGPIKVRLLVEGRFHHQAVWNAAGLVRANRRLGNAYTVQSPSSIWTLFDGQGRSFRRVGHEVVTVDHGTGPALEVRLTFQPDASLGPPERLVETGRRTVLLEVPFVLREVPLP